MKEQKKTKSIKADVLLFKYRQVDGQIFYLNENQKVEQSKYIVLKCNDKVNSKYLYYLLIDCLPTFLKKYQTDINIQPEIFKYLELDVHCDITTQNHIAEIFTNIDKQIKQEENLIAECKNFKKWHLGKMFM